MRMRGTTHPSTVGHTCSRSVAPAEFVIAPTPFQFWCVPVWKANYVIGPPRPEDREDSEFRGGQRRNPSKNRESKQRKRRRWSHGCQWEKNDPNNHPGQIFHRGKILEGFGHNHATSVPERHRSCFVMVRTGRCQMVVGWRSKWNWRKWRQSH